MATQGGAVAQASPPARTPHRSNPTTMTTSTRHISSTRAYTELSEVSSRGGGMASEYKTKLKFIG
ncbi:hypothetical protein E2C01_040479 [Portunus trituberculatus]|uniref:Uncharacterized protein n=1 Tax=Portunus trituberculatus TaxID=210409 RepID=A0A5B7FNW4_PORTR|nr:hypothetical protein [Portunus trituberculatus]